MENIYSKIIHNFISVSISKIKVERTSYKMLTGEKNVTASDFDYSKEYHQEEEISLNGSNLFTGMKQEVDIILSAIYFDLI